MPDQRLQLGYGSAWHLLRCLGWQRRRFSQALSDAIGVECIKWYDFPLGGRSTYPSGMPIRDSEWKRLNFAFEGLQGEYNTYWPASGNQQEWDAIGIGTKGTNRELILVEAKSHPTEIYFNGTEAQEDGGRPLIRQSFFQTLQACGFDETSAERQAEAWLTGCYQAANRLATLNFFLKHHVPAQLVFLYFCGDQHPSGKFCPSSPEQWEDTLTLVKTKLGLKGGSALEARVHSVILDVSSITVLDCCP